MSTTTGIEEAGATRGPEEAGDRAQPAAAARPDSLPPVVRRIAITSLIATAIVSLSLATRDPIAALAFGAASTWSTAYLILLWGPLSSWLLAPNAPGRGQALLAIGAAKVGLLVLLIAGLATVRWWLPAGFSPMQKLALAAGLGFCLFVAMLKAIGAKLTHRNFETGRANQAPRAVARRHSPLGGKA